MAFGPSPIRFLRRPSDALCSVRVPRRQWDPGSSSAQASFSFFVRRVGVGAIPKLPLFEEAARIYGRASKSFFCFFERSDGRFARDSRKSLQKVFERFSAFQAVEPHSDRDSHSSKHRSSSKNIPIFDDDFHRKILRVGTNSGYVQLQRTDLAYKRFVCPNGAVESVNQKRFATIRFRSGSNTFSIYLHRS
jgi:hypothetical protein